MTERQQIALKIIGLIAVAGVMGLVLYFMIFGGKPNVIPDAGTPEVTETPGGLPTADTGTPGTTPGGPTETGSGTLQPSPTATGGLTSTTLLTTASALQPTITQNGTVAYYDPKDGKFYTINADGDVVPLSQATFPYAQNIVFSNDAGSAVIEFPDGSNVVYDFNTGKQTTLPSHWEDFGFNQTGTAIASKSVGTDPSNRALVVTATDGSNTQVIAPLGANQDLVDVSWSPDGNTLGFSRTGSGGSAFGQNEIYLIGSDGEASGLLIVNGSNFKNIWAPDGRNLLYSVADAGDEYRSSLWYADSRGDTQGNTRVRIGVKTSANKCTFASAALAYCAVPRTMPAGGGSATSLVTAYDDLYSVSLPSGKTNLIAIPDKDLRMYNLTVSGNGDELYFSDASGRLNLIQLD
ncbi:MAG: hypothetical protein WAZ14_00385 [Patescibacteria group bacterium]